MVARWLRDSTRWLRHYPWKHLRRNRQRRCLRYAKRLPRPSKGEWRPIRRPRRPEHSRSRHRRTAKHLQLAAVHSRLTDRPHPASTVGGARTLRTPGDSRPPSSTNATRWRRTPAKRSRPCRQVRTSSRRSCFMISRKIGTARTSPPRDSIASSSSALNSPPRPSIPALTSGLTAFR